LFKFKSKIEIEMLSFSEFSALYDSRVPVHIGIYILEPTIPILEPNSGCRRRCDKLHSPYDWGVRCGSKLAAVLTH